MSECTFAPKLTAIYKSKTPVNVNAGKIDEEKPKQEISITNVVEVQTAQERLYKLRVAQKNKKDKAKVDYEFEKQAEECTFAPQIISKKPARASTAEKTERQRQAEQKQMERIQKAVEEKERKNTMLVRGIPKPKNPTSLAQIPQQEEPQS